MRRAGLAVVGFVSVVSACATPPPLDKPYLGPITLSVDATDVDHRIVRVRESLPVAPGPLVLHYPKWIPGAHGPIGNVTQMAGLNLRAGGRALAWARDPVEPETFTVTIPPDARTLDIEFEHLSPIGDASGRRTMSRDLVNVSWHSVLLYPAGHALSALRVRPTLTVPEGFAAATALRPLPSGRTTTFDEVSLETLIDSPVFAGRHHKAVPLDADGASRPVVLQLFADDPADLDAKPETIEAHRELVRQADRLFGARHFAHYDLLLQQSRLLGGVGLEHHQSSENGVKPGYFKDWGKGMKARTLVPHEYVHSWNGKFRRPAELTTPNLNVPMRDSLLWVYEGQTEYWGHVLATRSGLITLDESRDRLARTAAFRSAQAGRRWRSLQDTTFDPLFVGRGGRPWYDHQRGWDYYDEMVLVWLDVDTLLRERSGERVSLDDFARAFFGVEDGRVDPLTYRFDDVVKTLNALVPYDWASLLRARLDAVGNGDYLLEGLARAGWRLEFDETESDLARNAREADEESGPIDNFTWSVGVNVGKDGKVADVRWDGPAFRAGLAPGQQIVAVGGVAYKRERLAAAVTAAKGAGPAVELLVKDGERYRTVSIDHHGGLRYPKLVRVDGTPDRLSTILAARRP